MTPLNHERGGVATLHLHVRRRIERLIEAARKPRSATAPRPTTPSAPLARLYLEEYLKLLSDRALRHGPSPRRARRARPSWSGARPSSTLAARRGGPRRGCAERTLGSRSSPRALVQHRERHGQVNKNVIAQRLSLPRSR
jgi:hypothetical protein